MNTQGWVKGECTSKTCGRVFYAESNLGSMLCPYCQSKTKLLWGNFHIVFEEEGREKSDSKSTKKSKN